MDRAKAIGKVRKLRALAADRAATGPERELARERAGQLMAKHALAETDVAPSVVRRPARPAPAPFGFGNLVIVNTSTTTGGFPGNVTHVRVVFR